ncbi:uncharacterized protein LOC121860407 isoform X2 [Homarus americanus]|nr:uncharacterized protein LOC121860407 isoform X2 [Homarus americanus]
MIVVDDCDPEGELPDPFPPRNVKVKQDVDMHTFYDIKKEIGRGRFGTVYLVEDKATRQKFAAKFVNTKRNQDRTNVGREVEIMKALNSESPHPRLIQLYDAYDMIKEMCLVLEIVDGGELFERVINDDFILSEKACTVFIRQICQGIEFIHSKNILHLDMKPENILCLSREGNRVKICDFGLARRYDPRKKLQVLFGTPEFVAPEVVNFEPISFGTDMWSVGVICYVLLSGLSPFMGHNYVETMTNVTHNKYDFEDEAFNYISDEAKEFIQKLLVLDKSLRLTPAQCLRDDWLKKPPTCILHRSHPKEESESESEYDSDYELTDSDDSCFHVNFVNEQQQNEKERKKKEEEEFRKQVEAKRIELEKQVEDRKKELEKMVEAKNREEELQRTKAQLKEFVERWNSHPNSPYLVGTPIPLDLQKLVKTGGWDSRASLTSLGVAPPSDGDDFAHLDEDGFNFNDLDDATGRGVLINDIDNQEEFTMYTIEPPPSLTKQPSPEEVAKELEGKLTQLQLKDTVKSSKETDLIESLQDHVVPNICQATIVDKQEETIKTEKMQSKITNKNDEMNKSKETMDRCDEKQPKGTKILEIKKGEQKKASETQNETKEVQAKVIDKLQKMSNCEIDKDKKAFEEQEKMRNVNTNLAKGKDNQEINNSEVSQTVKEKLKSTDRKMSKGSKSNISEEPLEAEQIINDILNVDHKGAYEEYKRMVSEAQKVKKDEQKLGENLKENGDKEQHEQIPNTVPKTTASKQDNTNKRGVHKIIVNGVQKKTEEHKKNEIKKVNSTNIIKDTQRSFAQKQNTDKKANNEKTVNTEVKQNAAESLKTQEIDRAEHKRLYEEYKRMMEEKNNSKVNEATDKQNIVGKETVTQTGVYNQNKSKEPEKLIDATTMMTEIRKINNPDQLPKEPLKRPEIIALQKEELGGGASRPRKKSLPYLEQGGEGKDQSSRIITSKQNEDKECSPKSSRGNTPTKQLKKQPSRDVPLQANILEKDDHGGTPVLQISLRVGSLSSHASDNEGGRRGSLDMPGSPTRRSRKTSREDRPPSRGSDRSTRGGTPLASNYRRPSRDVPLSLAQIESLAAASDLINPDPVPQTQAWPDLIVATNGENDEDLNDYKDSLDVPVATLMKSPSGTLTSVPGVTVSQADKQTKDTSPSPNLKQDNKEQTTAEDDLAYVSNNKLVAWILDIGNNQVKPTPSISTSDRVNQWESRDSSPKLTPSPSRDRSPRPRDRSPLPNGREGDKSPALVQPQLPLQPMSQEASSDNLCIQTPWGTLRRSPSKSNLSKSPPFEVLATKVGDVVTNGQSSTEILAAKSDDSLSVSSSTRSPSPKIRVPRLQKQEAVEVAADTFDSQSCPRVSGEITPRPPEEIKETYKYEVEDIDRRTVVKKEDYKSHTLPRPSKLMKQRSSDCLNSFDRKKEVKKPPPIDTKKANEESNTHSLKRKSKFPPSPNQKKKIGPMLFSAQDRISQFEQKPASNYPPQRPITRTRSNVVLNLCSEKQPCDVNKNGLSGAKVVDKTQVGYLRTRLLDKVGKKAATLPEEPAQSEDPIHKNTTNNRQSSAGKPTFLR